MVEGEGLGVYIRFYDEQLRELIPAGGSGPVHLALAGNQRQWRQYSIEARAPAGTAAVRVWVHSFNSGLVTADFDEFRLLEYVR
jgi:hypothetical protein